MLSQRAVQRGADLWGLGESSVQPRSAVRRWGVQRDRELLDVQRRLRLFVGPGLLGWIVRCVPHDEPDVLGLVLPGPDVQRHSVRVLLRIELVRRRRSTLLLRRALQQWVHLRALFESRVQRCPSLR